MEIRIPNKFYEDVKKLYIPVPEVVDSLGKTYFTIDLDKLDTYKVTAFYNLLKGYPAETRALRSQINAWKAMKEAPITQKDVAFRSMPDEIADYIAKDASRGWVYSLNDEMEAFLITGVVFHPAVKERDYKRPAYISLHGLQNSKGTTKQSSWQISQDDWNKATPVQLMTRWKLQKETDELAEIYDELLEKYKVIRPMFGEQLLLTANKVHDTNNRRRRSTYWGADNDTPRNKVNLKDDHGGRLIHDDPQEESSFGIKSGNWRDPDDPWFMKTIQDAIARNLDPETKAFKIAPHFMQINCYHLGQHTNIDLHIRNVEVYKYEEGIKNKLVLSREYNEVLDVLTHDMLLVQEDIVMGKTGGTVILLAGPPGLAKTLTAEVYAEHKKVPLLKIHSGQLGTNAETIEERLLGFYQKASRWGVPVLLDEFDVFGRARGDNLEQNAVVAVFLRTLEYQKNTIFLTTNRADTMDDAILSRCAAIIRYDYPKADVLRDIWKVQRDQFCPNLTDELIEELMEWFQSEDKRMSGRDVKEILKLVARYETIGREVTKDLVIVASGFRGV